MPDHSNATDALGFEPIAIVGRGCILPGCFSPAALWETVAQQACRITPARPEEWQVDPARIRSHPPGRYQPNRTWSDRRGVIRGFSGHFRTQDTRLEPSLVERLDPVFQWSLAAARQALDELDLDGIAGDRAGVILGNLSYPTRAHTRLAAEVWRHQLLGDAAPPPGTEAHNRFMSGLPALLLARAWGFRGGSLALDAACASGLYAIKIACDRLQSGEADLMLAGAVNAADPLFLQVGFSALNALSLSGQSLPLQASADGLVPSEGAACVALKRLSDARQHGDSVLGVIRGIGLSNDGRSGGFLSPDENGQVRSMQLALAQSGWQPGDLQYVECHATGTQVGDGIEVASLQRVYPDQPLVLGSLKANLGHTITASGIAGLLKMLGAMEHATLPGMPAAGALNPALANTRFRVPVDNQPWQPESGRRRAAISSFGFGGNNAHLLLEAPSETSSEAFIRPQPTLPVDLAVVGLGIRTHLDPDAEAFARRMLGDANPASDFDGETLTLDARRLAFPPNELRQALGQQLLLLEVLKAATADSELPDPAQTGIYVGMQTDSNVCRYSTRIRWPELLAEARFQPTGEWVESASEALSPTLDSAGVIGNMPNIVANRLSNQLNLQGPGFAVSREELSGDAALALARTAIQRGEIRTALVAAVDLCRETVHRHAVREVLAGHARPPADAAVMLQIKSRTQAERDGDTILGIIPGAPPEEPATASLGNAYTDSRITAELGHAHAASGLLHIALGVLALQRRVDPTGRSSSPRPLLRTRHPLQLSVTNATFAGETAQWALTPGSTGSTGSLQPALPPARRLYCYAADSRTALLERLRRNQPGGEGSVRLAVVANADELPARLQLAYDALHASAEPRHLARQGIHFRSRPLAGELAFAFTGAAAAYPGMGRELLLGMPQLASQLEHRLTDARTALGWAFQSDANDSPSTPFEELAGSSCLCQLHAEFSRRTLGLRPDAVLGLSSGETNAMFAFDIWTGMDDLLAEIRDSGLYSDALAGNFSAIRAYWQLPASRPLHWVNLRIRASIERVRQAITSHQAVYLTIINSPLDCIIGGDAQACAELLKALGHPPAVAVPHELAVHCPVVTPFADTWRRLHTRPSRSRHHPRFYSNYFAGPFIPDRKRVADALTGQALQTVDFPAIIERAWADGVRLFVEHGPRDSLAAAIGEILGEREHLVVSFDRAGVRGDEQLLNATAGLWCAGVDMDLSRVATTDRPPATEPPTDHARGIRFRLHPPSFPADLLPPQKPAQAEGYHPPALTAGSAAGRRLPAPPPLAAQRPQPAVEAAPANPLPMHPAGSAQPVEAKRPAPTPPRAPGQTAPAAPAKPPSAPRTAADLIIHGHRHMLTAHQDFLAAQSAGLKAWQETQQRMQQRLRHPLASRPGTATPAPASATEPPAPRPSVPSRAREPSTAAPEHAERPGCYPGTAFSREQLEVLASGRISSVLGESFAFQDGYPIQVRMPAPPLLLCDRVLGIEGEPHRLGRGRIWTETHIQADSWYLHSGRMPGGIFIECGQADLLLISWLGIDAHNRGERAYRLLGCELVFHGDLPQPGDTLEYEISIDGHARQGDVRLFFFHYDCWINGERRISMRNGQAGFFTREELADAQGVIWSPEAATYCATPRLSPSPRLTSKRRFSRAELQAYLQDDLVSCFGPEFSLARTHSRTPRSPAGACNLLDEVTEFQPGGGPAGRGYLRVETDVTPNDWFFAGHFKNDPCMPGTLMADACLQAMAFYLVAHGWTLAHDGWRFQPVPDSGYTFWCRGQVTPTSKRIVYELFIDEMAVIDRQPTLFAHVLCTVDGRKAFLCERLGLQLVPDWPLTNMPDLLAQARTHDAQDSRPVACIDAFPLDYHSLLHTALGQPRLAFGEHFTHYEGPQRCPRLPGPPYHFIHRITHLGGTMMSTQPGGRLTALYDIPSDAWYFRDNGRAVMPTSVLMEVALQPCGWLASYTLDPEAARHDLVFRNLDGKAVQYLEVTPEHHTITTETRLTSVSRVGGLIIEKFALTCFVDGERLLEAETDFGFFPPAAMANQKGFSVDDDDRARLSRSSDLHLELAQRPSALFERPDGLRLPRGKLLMIDRISGYWPRGGARGLGSIRAEKDIRSDDWFFKAHFFQDPVQPGSLGIEAMLQTIQASMLLQGLAENLENPRFAPLDSSAELIWHYRGQVTPDRARVTVEFEVTDIEHLAGTIGVTGHARLWVDELQIYQAPRIGMRITSDPAPALTEPPASTHTHHERWSVDLREPGDAWLRDHCPTYILPALPFTYSLELMATAASRHFPGLQLQGIEQASALRWISLPEDTARGQVRVEPTGRHQARTALLVEAEDGSLQVAAQAQLRFGEDSPDWQAEAPLPPLQSAQPLADPYADGTLFHGPALQLMQRAWRGKNGARAELDLTRCGVAPGTLHPGALDAALHCLPHNDFSVWTDQISADQAAFPARIERLQLDPALLHADSIEVEARWRGMVNGRPQCQVRLMSHQRIVADFWLTEYLLPKGRLGGHPGARRRRFLQFLQYVPAVALARTAPDQSVLWRQDVTSSDLLPGTVQRVYRLPDEPASSAEAIVTRDHAGQILRLHPSSVVTDAQGDCRNTPLNPFRIELQPEAERVLATGSPQALDLTSVRRAWAPLFKETDSPLLELGLRLAKQFVRRLVLSDPEGFHRQRQHPALYLANHQTGVESFLFLMLTVAVSGIPAGAIAKSEHRNSWLGRVFQLADRTLGKRNPMFMLFFERANQADLLRLMQEFANQVDGSPRSLLVHVDGTRSLQAGAPVAAVSSVLIDLAIDRGLPIVPVRFAGGLGQQREPRGLEFPFAMGQQDYFIGKAITPEQLEALPYAERAAHVRQSLNALGPQGEADIPLPSDTRLQAAVESISGDAGSEVAAVMRALLAVQSGDRTWLAPDFDAKDTALTRLLQELTGS